MCSLPAVHGLFHEPHSLLESSQDGFASLPAGGAAAGDERCKWGQLTMFKHQFRNFAECATSALLLIGHLPTHCQLSQVDPPSAGIHSALIDLQRHK